MTIAFKGTGGDDINEREWALLNTLGNLGRTGLITTNVAGDRTASVAVGAAAVGGVLCEVTAAHSVTAASNTSGNPRQDLVTWRIDWNAAPASAVTLVVKQGTPAANPVPPTVTQTAGTLWEEPLALLKVASGQGAFTAADVVTLPSPRISVQHDQPLNAGPSSTTTYVFASDTCFATFVAPPSGRVEVSTYANLENTTTNVSAHAAPEIRSGISQTGTVVTAAADTNGVINQGDQGQAAGSGPLLVTGLIPGSIYTAWVKVRVSGGTGNWFHRRIHVRPII